jgi:Protein of unknown function (DUF3592)
VSIVLTCGLSVLAFFCIVVPLGRRLRRITWDYCPATLVTIKTGNVQKLRQESGFLATLGYIYQVNGVYYSGFYGKSFDTKVQAYWFVSRYTGKSLLSFYKPENPSESLLSL